MSEIYHLLLLYLTLMFFELPKTIDYKRSVIYSTDIFLRKILLELLWIDYFTKSKCSQILRTTLRKQFGN